MQSRRSSQIEMFAQTSSVGSVDSIMRIMRRCLTPGEKG